MAVILLYERRRERDSTNKKARRQSQAGFLRA
jgi:hypothetical protein